MLIKTISFDIPNLRDNSTESFLILDTINNQEFVLSHPRTRNIQFGKTFDFQLEKDMRMPVEMISDTVWLALLPEMEKEMAEFADENEIDIAIDETCNCENLKCEHGKNEEMCGNIANPEMQVIHIGAVCNECAIHYADYIITDEN